MVIGVCIRHDSHESVIKTFNLTESLLELLLGVDFSLCRINGTHAEVLIHLSLDMLQVVEETL